MSRKMWHLVSLVALIVLILTVSAASAQSLGSASGFAVLGGPAVTCTASSVTGDVGVVLASGFTNTGCVIVGTVHQGDAAATMAYADFLVAYTNLGTSPPPCTATLSGTLSGVTLPPGVYCFPAAATLTGTLFLDAQFGPNPVWIFRVGTLGTGALTGTNFTVEFINGGQPCNASWWVAEAATMTTSAFKGNILAGAAIDLTGGTFSGHALAKAAVTLTNTSASVCAAPPAPPPMDKCEADDDDHDDDGDDDHHDDKDHHHKDKKHKDRDDDHKERKEGKKG